MHMLSSSGPLLTNKLSQCFVYFYGARNKSYLGIKLHFGKIVDEYLLLCLFMFHFSILAALNSTHTLKTSFPQIKPPDK